MSYESRHFTGDDARDELTQPEPTLCVPCDDEGIETPATTSIYRGQYRVALPVCADCQRAWENREQSDTQIEAAQMSHYDRLEEARR